MGANIMFGLVTHIEFTKKETEEVKKYIPDVEQLKSVLAKKINLDMSLFSFREKDECYSFVINDEILEPRHLLEFLNDFLHEIYLNDAEEFDFYCKDLLEKVAELKTAQEVIQCSENRDDDDIKIGHVWHHISGIEGIPFYSGRCSLQFIRLFYQGKVLFEVYQPFFSYIERLICSKYPQEQAKAIKILLQ